MPKFEKDELKRRVDEVLFYIWDPIGVSPNPDARTEYCSYAKKILDFLHNDCECSKIQKYLYDIESGMLGLPAKEKRAQKVAELIMRHKEAIEAGVG